MNQEGQSQPRPEENRLHGIPETARRLSVSPWTVRKWCQTGRMASMRLGARRLIAESEIQRVMVEGLRVLTF